MAFTERTVAPAVNNKYYVGTGYGGLNRCIIIDRETGSVLPNCTGYAYGRFMESTGARSCSLPTTDAGTWYDSTIYQKGQTPRLGAIACWTGGSTGKGHVAFVEHIDASGRVTVSESGYYSKVRFQRREMSPPFNFTGLSFQGFIYNPQINTTGDGKQILPEGKSSTEYNGQKIIIYGQRNRQRLGMISAPGSPATTALADIKQIDNADIVLYASMNANYFQMQQGQSDPYGTHYGTEISMTNHFTPHQGNVLAYAIKKDGQSIGCADNEFWYTAQEVQFACAPAYIAYLRGQKVALWSSAFRKTKSGAGTQSMLIRTADRFAFAVVTGSLTVADCVEWAEKNISGLMDLIFMDSGGSSQLLVGYDVPVYTGRKIPNVLAFYAYKTEAQPIIPDVPDDPGEDPEPDPVPEPDPGEDPRDQQIQQLQEEVERLRAKLEQIKAIAAE